VDVRCEPVPLAEQELAYDVVHSLNRFFKEVGDPILANGGVINKYLGDGLEMESNENASAGDSGDAKKSATI